MTDLGTLVGLTAPGPQRGGAGRRILRYRYGQLHAFLYSNGVMIDLSSSFDGNSYARGINEAGRSSGPPIQLSTRKTLRLPLQQRCDDRPCDVGRTGSEATGINDAGQVIGNFYTSYDQPVQYRAFLYSNGMMTNLGSLGGTESYAADINEVGQVVGALRG